MIWWLKMLHSSQMILLSRKCSMPQKTLQSQGTSSWNFFLLWEMNPFCLGLLDRLQWYYTGWGSFADMRLLPYTFSDTKFAQALFAMNVSPTVFEVGVKSFEREILSSLLLWQLSNGLHSRYFEILTQRFVTLWHCDIVTHSGIWHCAIAPLVSGQPVQWLPHGR